MQVWHQVPYRLSARGLGGGTHSWFKVFAIVLSDWPSADISKIRRTTAASLSLMTSYFPVVPDTGTES
jgi:hypothetical protein